MRNGRERRPPGPARAAPPPLLATERGGDVSCVPSVGFRGMWGTWPAPRPRTAWSFPIEGEGSSAGLRVRAGTGIDRGARGNLGSPGTPPPPPRRWRLPLERGCGEEKGKAAPGKPRGRSRSWLSFRLWLASGPAEPRYTRGLARTGSAGCQRCAALRGLRSRVRRAAAARWGWPRAAREPGGGRAPQGTPGRARGLRPCAGRGQKAAASPGTAALRRLRGKQDPAAVRCTGACSWQPPASQCLQGRGYKLNIVCAAGTKYPGLTGIGGRGQGLCSSAHDE